MPFNRISVDYYVVQEYLVRLLKTAKSVEIVVYIEH